MELAFMILSNCQLQSCEKIGTKFWERKCIFAFKEYIKQKVAKPIEWINSLPLLNGFESFKKMLPKLS